MVAALPNVEKSVSRVLQLFNRKGTTKLRNPLESKNFFKAMKAAAAIWGAQGHHVFDQKELRKAFQGRTEDLYLRVVKRLNDAGVHVNDSAKNVIATHGNQAKGTAHRNIHDLYKQLPDIDYSSLSENELVETLINRAVERKRIAASMIDQTIKGLYEFDPTLKSLPPRYLAAYIKENPDIVHNVTKNIPLKLPTANQFPIHPEGGPGTIKIPKTVRDFLKVGHGEGVGQGGYFNLMPPALALASKAGSWLTDFIPSGERTEQLERARLTGQDMTQPLTGYAFDSTRNVGLSALTGKLASASGAFSNPITGAAALMIGAPLITKSLVETADGLVRAHNPSHTDNPEDSYGLFGNTQTATRKVLEDQREFARQMEPKTSQTAATKLGNAVEKWATNPLNEINYIGNQVQENLNWLKGLIVN